MTEQILILGGGIGGVVAAKVLRRRLPRRHRVVVVDREPRFEFAASFLWVMTGSRRPEQIVRPLAASSARASRSSAARSSASIPSGARRWWAAARCVPTTSS